MEAGDLHSGLLLDLLGVLVVCAVEVELAEICWKRLLTITQAIEHLLLMVSRFLGGSCLLVGGASGLCGLDE